MWWKSSRIGIIYFLVFWGFQANGQQLIGSSGSNTQSKRGSLYWSLGEPISCVVMGDNYCLTQGFQQSAIIVTEVREPIEVVFKIKVYPNPVLSVLTIQTVEFDQSNMAFKLFDSMGRVVRNGEILASNTQVSMEHLVPSLYYLKIYNGSNEVKIFKVIKQ